MGIGGAPLIGATIMALILGCSQPSMSQPRSTQASNPYRTAWTTDQGVQDFLNRHQHCEHISTVPDYHLSNRFLVTVRCP